MKSIEIKNHIDIDHRVYASYDNVRNIAHIADGLKPSQRKIIYTAIETLKRGTETKVANLGSRASDYCFAPDTLVQMSDGSKKPISEVEWGDFVLNYNPRTNMHAIDKVVGVWNRGEKEVVEVEMEDGSTFKCTSDHKFLTKNGWKSVRDIGPDEIILML